MCLSATSTLKTFGTLKSAFVEALVFRRSNRLLLTLGRLLVSGYRLTSPHSS